MLTGWQCQLIRCAILTLPAIFLQSTQSKKILEELRLVLALQPPSSLELLPGTGALGERLLPRQVDVVVTCFFLDCLPDTLAAVRAIRDALAPGGVWVFAGPLEYHHWPGLVPTLSQLRELAREEGLEPLGEPRFVSAPYLGKANSLLHKQQYRAALFACRRRSDGGVPGRDLSTF